MSVHSVFLIDDDTDDKEIFIAALEEVDPDVKCSTAANGREALEKIVTQQVKADLILLDLNMPLMNGKQFLTEIKKTSKVKDVPVIIYSTSTETKDVVDTIQMGAVFFLQKPNRFEDLSKALSGIISRKWQ